MTRIELAVLAHDFTRFAPTAASCCLGDEDLSRRGRDGNGSASAQFAASVAWRPKSQVTKVHLRSAWTTSNAAGLTV